MAKKKPEPAIATAKPTNVEVVTVGLEPYHETLSLPARIVADEVVAVSCETDGVLMKWVAAEGTHVEKGDLIAQKEKSTLLAKHQQLLSSVKAQEASVGISEAEVELARMSLKTSDMDKETCKMELKAAQSSRMIADRDYSRKAELLRRSAVSESSYDTAEDARTQAAIELDKARTALGKAEVAIQTARTNLKLAEEKLRLGQAQLELTKAQLEEVEIQLAKTEIRAPVSGVLDKHLVDEGELASPGTRLVHIYKNDTMRALVDVPDRHVSFLDIGNATIREYVHLQAPGAEQNVSAKIVIPGLPRLTGGFREGVELPAEIARIAAASDETSNTFRVELKIQNLGGALRHGLLCQAVISFFTYPEAVLIPVKAVQVSELGPRVLVAVEKDGKTIAEVRNIEPGGIKEGKLLITKGLQAGERLIVSGQRGLVHGESVEIIRENGRYTTQLRNETS
jgi:RND family efflux transporter MFP subunit